MNEIRVLVADDRALIRSGIRAHLEELPGLQIVAEAKDGPEALRLIRHHQPDVAVIESAMCKLNGFEVTARVKKECPTVHVIVLSTHAEGMPDAGNELRRGRIFDYGCLWRRTAAGD